jgi:RTX calcium-binding nonapeptide repeat (4 copies)
MATIKGTSKNETIKGTSKPDNIDGKAGDDIINGLAGADTISGGDGKDTLIGGLGGDTMTGGKGADKFVINFGDSFSKLPIKSNFDKITDFSKSQGDTIHITNQNGATADIAHTTITSTNKTGFVDTANFKEGKLLISGFSIDKGGMLHLYTDQGHKGNISHPEIKNATQTQALNYAQANSAALPHDEVLGVSAGSHTYLVDNHPVPGYTMVDVTGSISSLVGIIV